MRFIRVWSYSCANYLMRQLNESHEKRGVYYYGFQIIIGVIIKGVFLIAISRLLGALIPTLLALAAFATFRMTAGGYHMDTYGKCIITSLSMYILAGLAVQYTNRFWSTEAVIALIAASFVPALYVAVKWAPGDTPNKPITKPGKIRRLKILSIIYVIGWLILVSVMMYYRLNAFVMALCFGLILEAFTVSPAGYGFFDRISGKVEVQAKGK